MTCRHFVSSLLFYCFIASAAVAKDKDKELEVDNQRKVEEEIKKETPISEWISSEKALLKRLPLENQKIFFIFRDKHGVIRAVETVERDVGNAVTACAKNNKGMSKKMKARFKEWRGVVNPILKEAKKSMSTDLKNQKAFHITDYTHITELNDKAYKFSESQVQKTPVTTKEACEGLLASMDRTEEKLIDILQEVLLPEEVIRKRLEHNQKIEEESSSKK